jgi:acetyl esterase/lipase
MSHKIAAGLIVALLCCGLSAAEPKPKEWVPPELPAGVRAVLDVPYIERGHQRQRLDIFLPEKSEGRRPLVVWIHGGAWLQRSKEYCVPVWLVEKGYVLASIGYRLSQHAVFPAQIEDCKAGIRWLRAHAAEYHFDPDRIGVWGASAGGHLVSLLGTTGDCPDFRAATEDPSAAMVGARPKMGVSPFVGKPLEGKSGNLDQSSRVQCVVDWCGPSDLAALAAPGMALRGAVEQLLGGPLSKRQELARKASPLGYVSKDSAPFLIVHGDGDTTVPLLQSEMLAAALQKAGGEVTLVVLKGCPHGGPKMYNAASYKLVEAFFGKHLKTK